jgi:hypothetical protein
MDTWEALQEKLIETLHQEIDRAEAKVKDEYARNTQEVIEHFSFPARRAVIKGFCNTIESVKEAVIEQYPDEYYYRNSSGPYPRKWMTDDKRINAKLKDFKIVELLNYLFKINQYIKGDAFEAMTALADKLTEGKRHNNKHAYSVFTVNKDFYAKATKALKLSQRTLQKYLQAFCNAGIVSMVDKITEGMVYADGFFMQLPDGKLRKIHFLQKTLEYKNALRNFDINAWRLRDVRLRRQ